MWAWDVCYFGGLLFFLRHTFLAVHNGQLVGNLSNYGAIRNYRSVHFFCSWWTDSDESLHSFLLSNYAGRNYWKLMRITSAVIVRKRIFDEGTKVPFLPRLSFWRWNVFVWFPCYKKINHKIPPTYCNIELHPYTPPGLGRIHWAPNSYNLQRKWGLQVTYLITRVV